MCWFSIVLQLELHNIDFGFEYAAHELISIRRRNTRLTFSHHPYALFFVVVVVASVIDVIAKCQLIYCVITIWFYCKNREKLPAIATRRSQWMRNFVLKLQTIAWRVIHGKILHTKTSWSADAYRRDCLFRCVRWIITADATCNRENGSCILRPSSSSKY